MGDVGQESPARHFLAERFLPRCTPEILDSIVAEVVAASGAAPIELTRMIYVHADESLYLLLDAPSADAVARMSDRFHLDLIRVQEAREIDCVGRTPVNEIVPKHVGFTDSDRGAGT